MDKLEWLNGLTLTLVQAGLQVDGWPSEIRDGLLDLQRDDMTLRLSAREAVENDPVVTFGVPLLVDLELPIARRGHIRFETYQFGESARDACAAAASNLIDGLLLPLRMLLGGPDHRASERLEIRALDDDAGQGLRYEVVVGPLHLIRADAATRAQLEARTPFLQMADWLVAQLVAEFHWMWLFVTHHESEVGGGALLDGHLFQPPPLWTSYVWPTPETPTIFRQFVLARRLPEPGTPIE